jgi:hypothetical protein
MSRRTVIRRATFVAFLVAWPIAVEWAKRRFPHEAGVHGVAAVASLVVYVACAAALRSRVIAGLLGGVLVWAMTNAFTTITDPEGLGGTALPMERDRHRRGLRVGHLPQSRAARFE